MGGPSRAALLLPRRFLIPTSPGRPAGDLAALRGCQVCGSGLSSFRSPELPQRHGGGVLRWPGILLRQRGERSCQLAHDLEGELIRISRAFGQILRVFGLAWASMHSLSMPQVGRGTPVLRGVGVWLDASVGVMRPYWARKEKTSRLSTAGRQRRKSKGSADEQRASRDLYEVLLFAPAHTRVTTEVKDGDERRMGWRKPVLLAARSALRARIAP